MFTFVRNQCSTSPEYASAYILLFEPYGYRVTSRDYEHIFKVLLFPPVVLVISYFVYNKLIKPSRTDIRSGSHGDDS